MIKYVQENIRQEITRIMRLIDELEEKIVNNKRNIEKLEAANQEVVQQKHMFESDVSQYSSRVNNQLADMPFTRFITQYQQDVGRMLQSQGEKTILESLNQQITEIRNKQEQCCVSIEEDERKIKNYKYELEDLKRQLAEESERGI